MKHEFTLKSSAHAGAVASALEEAGLKLHADTPNDTVHGSVTCRGNVCIVEIYDAPSAPDKDRKSTLAVTAKPASRANIAAKLTAAGLI